MIFNYNKENGTMSYKLCNKNVYKVWIEDYRN